jgi:hypothetical protein
VSVQRFRVLSGSLFERIRVRNFGTKVRVDRPHLPAWLDRIEILGLRVGDARIDLVFTSREGITATEVPRKEGNLELLIRQ